MDEVLTPVIGCPPSPLGYASCRKYERVYSSQEVSGSCPLGTVGEPVTVEAGRFTSTVSQADADAQAQTHLTQLLTQWCEPAVPVVTSETVTVGSAIALNYQIKATFSPTSYAATGLPSGLSLDAGSGIISGTINNTNAATYTVAISATSAAGTGNGTLTINVRNGMGIRVFFNGAPLSQSVLSLKVDGQSVATTDGAAYTAYSSVKLAVAITSPTALVGSNSAVFGILMGTASASPPQILPGSSATGSATVSAAGTSFSIQAQCQNSIGSQIGPSFGQSSTTAATLNGSSNWTSTGTVNNTSEASLSCLVPSGTMIESWVAEIDLIID